jgi:hypothetical protein
MNDANSIEETGIFFALNQLPGGSVIHVVRHGDDERQTKVSVASDSLAKLVSIENVEKASLFQKSLNVAGIEVIISGVSFWIEEYAGGIFGIDGEYYRFKAIPPELESVFGIGPD